MYFNCNQNTNTKERRECFDEVSKADNVTVDSPNLTYPQYLDRIKEHMFALSPRGNGLDCHRTWEILMMRRVPTIKREGQLERLYGNMPVIFVDNWSDIYTMNLKKIFKTFSFNNQKYLEFDSCKSKLIICGK